MPEVEVASETAQIPLSLLGGQALGVGDVVRLRVVSVDDEGGTATVEYDHPEEPKEPANSEEMASELEADAQYNLDA